MSLPADLRSTLDVLDRRGGLARVGRTVDPGGEVTAVLAAFEAAGNDAAVLFTSVAGYEGWRIAGSLFADRANVAAALGTDPSRLTVALAERLEQPIPPEVVGSGPCQERAFLGA